MTTATKKQKKTPVDPEAPVYQGVRFAALAYGEVTDLRLEGCSGILGVLAQVEGGYDEEGKALRKYARTVEPRLSYHYVSGAPTREIRVFLLQGQGDLPLERGVEYEFLGDTIDRNPRHSGYATAWLVTKK